MTDAIESKPARFTRPPIPIRDMTPWSFWALPDAIGLSPEDAAAVDDGTATPEQIARMEACAAAAKCALMEAETNVNMARPS